VHPKERRKRARSQHSGEAADERSGEQRQAERVAARKAKAAARSRYRASQRAKRQKSGESGTGTPPAEREPGTKRIRQGLVTSSKADKTITVAVESARRHPTYEKIVRRSKTLHAHDERNEAGEGDMVRVIESRPMSRTKRWRLVEIVERAK
jgi:small subunit ribosomal protein S17